MHKITLAEKIRPNRKQDSLPNKIIGIILYNTSNNSRENTLRGKPKKALGREI